MKRLLVVALAGCGSSQATALPPQDTAQSRILEAARVYRDWGRVDETPRIAPALCAAPGGAPKLRVSAAEAGPHEQKKYFLYASDRAGYLGLQIKPGFAIVKESIDFAGRPADLFVMVRGDEWIYGTVSPDGKITSAGQVESCIGCHVEAPHDRLFGIRSAEDSD